MAVILLNIAAFRLQFPAFSNVTTFPDATIQMYFDMATNYASTNDYGFLRGTSRTLTLYLLTAHLLAISGAIAAGQPLQVMAGATEGSVSISFVPPPAKNGWQWWLSATPYGQQLWALLCAVSVGGFYVGGAYNRLAFRRPDGSF